jgi:predicted glycoside hydrolase/deacetylase ChbG (UPF0249 family)
MKLVVTADDFGLSEAVDEGILTAFRQGVVTNTTLVVNFPNIETSVAHLRDADGLDVGIHLNLTSGGPVLKAKQVASLVGNAERFLGLVGFFARIAIGGINWIEVEHECMAQIERGLAMGCQFSSITSHQHVHMLPQLARICAKLAKVYGIPVVRLSRYHRVSIFSPIRSKALVLLSYAAAVQRILEHQGVLHNDYLLDIPPLRAETALSQLCNTLPQLSGALYELVCHPGYVDTTLQCRDRYTVNRLVELEVLTAPEIQGIFQKNRIELTTYRALSLTGRCDVTEQTERND